MTVRPENRSDLIETMRGMLEPVRVEKGCMSYRLCEDVENRNSFVLLEEWQTREDLESHIRSEHTRRLLALMDLLSEPPEWHFNSVSHTSGIDLVGDVMNMSAEQDESYKQKIIPNR